MGELKIVAKNKEGEVKAGFRQTRVKGKINKYDLNSKVLQDKSKSLTNNSWALRTKELNKR
jgi:hypothetical protein